MSWPIKCRECGSDRFRYKSDRTGNVRRYECKECHAVFIATVKGLSSNSVFDEPKNLGDEDLHWAKVVTDETSS